MKVDRGVGEEREPSASAESIGLEQGRLTIDAMIPVATPIPTVPIERTRTNFEELHENE